MPTIEDLLAQHNIHLASTKYGQYKCLCPQCSASRKPHHKKLKVLSVKIDADGVCWHCNHCDWSGPQAGANGHWDDHRTRYWYDDNAKIRNKPRMPPFLWVHLEDGVEVKGSRDLPPDALYRIDEAKEVRDVIAIVEGEKDVDTLWSIGVPATCNAHGAGKWTSDHSAILAGFDIVVFNDNDDVGRAHADDVVRHSHGVVRSIRRVDLSKHWEGMPVGADVSDALDQHKISPDELVELIRNAEFIGANPEPPSLFFRASIWDGIECPPQQWTVTNVIPARHAALLSGHGSVGKSYIALDLAICHVVGKPWLKFDCRPGAVMFVEAEDDTETIWRRASGIAAHYEISMRDLHDLHILSLAGESAVLARSDRNGIVIATELFKRIVQEAADTKPAQIIIASAANVFAGNENDRSQVQQFVQMLTHLAQVTFGSVILITHPSRASLSPNTPLAGLSGSTAWHNSVRARMVVEGVKEEEQGDSDARKLSFHKTQYGPPQESVSLRWRNGKFALDSSGEGAYEKAAREQRAEHVFMHHLQALLVQGRNLSHKPSSPHNYAPKVIHALPGVEVRMIDLASAMERLFKANRIKVVVYQRKWERIEPV